MSSRPDYIFEIRRWLSVFTKPDILGIVDGPAAIRGCHNLKKDRDYATFAYGFVPIIIIYSFSSVSYQR